jgi:hypothetical protein
MRKLVSFILIIFLALGVIGCSIFGPGRDDIAKKLLKEKYNEEFDIFSSGEGYGILPYDTFKVVAAPKGNKDLLFEAKIEKEGAWMIDEYVEVLVEDEIKQIASGKISELKDDFFIKVYIDYADTKFKNKESVSLESFISEYPDSLILITLLLDKSGMANIGAEKEYQFYQKLFSESLPINGALEIYYTDGTVLQEAKEYFKENAETYYGFEKKLEGYQDNGFGINAGQLNVSLDQFKAERQVQ